MTENLVTRWFGDACQQLHPLLQQLHREGGALIGKADIRFGAHPVARWLGKRLATKWGILHDGTSCDFEVEITHTPQYLRWCREFGRWQRCSYFEPVGTYPDGYWQEFTGNITLLLGVEIKNGGWHWQQRAVRWKGLPLPRWLSPQTVAYKRIEDGQYLFSVAISLPVVGLLLSYSGKLKLLRMEENPPWIRFPGIESGIGFWRQAKGEWWMDKWLPYWNSLSPVEQQVYLEQYSPNEDWREWLELMERFAQEQRNRQAHEAELKDLV